MKIKQPKTHPNFPDFSSRCPPSVNRPGRRPRETEGFQFVEWETQERDCQVCGNALVITQHRVRRLQTLKSRLVAKVRDRRCSSPQCPAAGLIVRPIEELRNAIPHREYGLDVVCLVLEKRFQEMSLPEIHRLLVEEHGVRISQRHVGNLLRYGLALVKARDLHSSHLRAKLAKQEGIILSVDAVRFDEGSRAIYVLRDAVSGEFLLCERLEVATTEAIVRLFREVKKLGVPVLGVISDKEAAFVGASRKVFPDSPHQYCQVHYLKNLAVLAESDSANVGRGVRATTQRVRLLEGQLLKRKRPPTEGEGLREFSTVLNLCKVVGSAGKCRGVNLLNPTPLKRYNRLCQVRRAVKEAQAKPGGPWKFLTRLAACLEPLDAFQSEAERLDDRVYTLQQIALTFSFNGTAAQIEDALKSYLDLLEASLREDQSPWWQQFVEHVLKISTRFWTGLFHSYDSPELPKTNNGTEAFFGTLKRLHRKTTGRKSTSGGPVETCPEFFFEALSILKGWPQEKIHVKLQGVHPEEVSKALTEFQKLAEPSRVKRSISRDTEGALNQIVQRWQRKSDSI